MAWRRKKGGARKEPRFGLAAAMADLRLDPKDRIPAAEGKPKKPAKRQADDDDDDDDAPPPERKPRVSKSGAKRRAKSGRRLRLGRLAYWGAVLSLWAVIMSGSPGRSSSPGICHIRRHGNRSAQKQIICPIYRGLAVSGPYRQGVEPKNLGRFRPQ